MNRRCGFLIVCSLVACFLALLGCSSGSTLPRTKGQVLLDGQPVSDATVEFLGVGGRSTTTDKEGKFDFDGSSAYKAVKPGTYKVTISKFVDLKGQPLEDVEQAKAAGQVKPALPAIYGSGETTPIKVDVKEGKNELKPFELKSK